MSDEAKPERDIEAGVEREQPSASADEVKDSLSASPNTSDVPAAVQEDEVKTEVKSPVDAKDVQEDEAETEVKSPVDAKDVQEDEAETEVKSPVDAKDVQKEPDVQEKTSDDAPTASSSKSEDARTVDNVEAGIASPRASRMDRCMECGLMESFIRVLLYVITLTFIVYFITSFFNPSTPDHMYGQIVVGIFIALIILFILVLLTVKEWDYDISWPWNQLGVLLGRMMTRNAFSVSEGGRNLSDSGVGDIESQTTNQKDLEMAAEKQDQGEGSTDKTAPQQCNKVHNIPSTDKTVPQQCNQVQTVPSTSRENRRTVVTVSSDIRSSTKCSEVASAVSAVLTETLREEKPNLKQIDKASPEPKEGPADEIANSEVKRSDSEPLSSGEIRRRKFQNVEQSTVSSSSDEEIVKKE